jgi:steroid delta-isomerase-like uncharacterized protein
MVTSAISRVSQDYLKAFNAHDIEKIVAHYTNDCMIESVGTGQVKRGPAELRKYYEEFFMAFPDAKMEFTNDFRCNDMSATEWVLSGTQKGKLLASAAFPELPPTNKKIAIKGATINLIRQDKIYKETDYWNMAAYMQQLGLMPASMPK